MVLLSQGLCRRVTMRGIRNVKVRMSVTEQMIRTALCKKLQKARGNLFTVKTGQLCDEMMHSDVASMSCRVAARRFLLSVLRDAIVGELSGKYRIVVLVNEARRLLGCGHEDQGLPP
jgi:hypothetical protein